MSNRFERLISKNVVGVLRGAKQPDDVVIYIAHWDHLGRCKPDPDGDDLCNGALDNASGTAGILAIAQIFARGPRPQRSVMFLAVTADEQGLLGSRYYTEHPLFPLGKTVAGVNIDGLNVLGRFSGFSDASGGKSEIDGILEPVVRAQGRKLLPDSAPEIGFFYRSDQASFARAGIPMIFGTSDGEPITKSKADIEAWVKEFGRKYHRPGDEYDVSWDWSGAAEDLEVFYRFGRRLADSNVWPNWSHGVEFRAARDKARAIYGSSRR